MKIGDIEKLKAGDKIVVEIEAIYKDHHSVIVDGKWLNYTDILGKLEDFQPAEEKIKMTAEEKKEFDELIDDNIDFYSFITNILYYKHSYPLLHERLFEGSVTLNSQAQSEFMRAIENPSLIEVEKEKKYRIKLVDGYLVNVMGDWLTLKNKKDGDIFTQSKIDEMQTLQKFKAIDLNKCKEEI